ncbi:SMI1/KNR4 family protein [Flavobacterium sp. LM4]|uniref:SMI1/KNR4 family protein n=1 Tax=Flavobacterium sp. LM4 TaxID=1938609 RepID=UPI0009929A0D|nr:SMI1/KNR4 family protein [Flavobacterium sp. LM4]OOV19217.1 SMI1/KNR4 family protein [Flavobacterium sp. LM4]
MNEHLQLIFDKYDFPKNNQNSFVTIRELEEYSNLKLPDDYIFYLENYTGIDQFVGAEFIKFWGLEEIIEANKSYNIFKELQRTIGIGTNGSGEFIGIVFDSNNVAKIIISPFVDLNAKYHTEIGVSFTDFLIRLDKGIEWFL